MPPSREGEREDRRTEPDREQLYSHKGHLHRPSICGPSLNHVAAAQLIVNEEKIMLFKYESFQKIFMLSANKDVNCEIKMQPIYFLI